MKKIIASLMLGMALLAANAVAGDAATKPTTAPATCTAPVK